MAQINNILVMGDMRILGDLYANNNSSIRYGTCATNGSTAIKIVNIADPLWKLKTGSIVVVKVSSTNTASNPKLNINNTGAKSIWYNDAIITNSYLKMAGNSTRPSMYIYDGTNYVWIGWAADGKLQDNLATVATSGSYSDLSGYPTGSLTLQGTTYQLNSSTNQNVNIVVPQYTSDLTNTTYLTSTPEQSIEVTAASDSKGEVDRCSVTKIGKLIFLHLEGIVLEDVWDSGAKVFHGTLPSGYRPVYTVCASYDHSMYGNRLMGVITSSGDVSVYALQGYYEWAGFDFIFVYFTS